MTLHTIRSNKALADWWAGIFASPNFQSIWKMMNDSHPLRFTEAGAAVTTPSSDKRLGAIEGYELALRRLELCASFEEPLGEMPTTATWEPMDTPEIEQPS